MKKNRPLKKSKTGIEVEFHLIDINGRISNKAPELLSTVKRAHPGIQITKECGKNMIEFGCYPGVPAYNPSLDLISSIEKTVEICNKKDLMLFPFATYPGGFEPKMTPGSAYNIKKEIFGLERFNISMRCTGFHHHYTLPKGVFDAQKKIIRVFRKSKLKRSMMGSYNFEIAADPALTLFTQSSPFYQGINFAKDTRMIVYRGGRKLSHMDGLYAKHQQVGGLPPYKQTATDLLTSLKKRWIRWEKEIKMTSPRTNFDNLYPYKLDIGWNPVKINKLGTLEQRGMDMNFMSVIIAVTVMLKFCLRKIQREFLEVVAADSGVEEAFKIEGPILYVPPQTYVRDKLQYWSAYKGYDNKNMYEYIKRFYAFAKSVMPKRYRKVIAPLSDMVENKTSMSDKILRHARYKGYLDDNKLSRQEAAEFALHYANQFSKDMENTKKALQKVAMV